MNPPPSCPNCNTNAQVWTNQLSGKLKCHRVFCNTDVPNPTGWKEDDTLPTPEGFVEVPSNIQHVGFSIGPDTGDVVIPILYKRKKPSLFARLFKRIGEKRRGWSGRRED